jgi:hypothetical protein
MTEGAQERAFGKNTEAERRHENDERDEETRQESG